MNYSTLELGDMSVQNIYILWAICAPILLFAGWRVTKKIQSKHIRIISRSFIVALACGISGFGTDSAVVLLPAWALIIPQVNYSGIYVIVIWWVLVLVIYYLTNFVYKKLQSK